MMKKCISLFLVCVILLCLAACNSEPDTVVYVQNVGRIVGIGTIAISDKFAGVVVSENATKVSRDYSRSISMLYVTEGQDVVQGDILFTYDSEALELEVEKLKLEMERLEQLSTTIKSQITQLETDMKKASKEDQLSYTINIQEKQAALKENEYSITLKKREITQTQNTLTNAQVAAPISGRIISIKDENSGGDAFITIQQAGTYRVKATLNELNRGAIMEGVRMKITARNDNSQSWYGTVSMIDLEGGTSGSNDNYYFGGVDEYSSTTKYPFYVELETIDGLMLGQHVFVEVDRGDGDEQQDDKLMLPDYYICYDNSGDDAKPFVWAESSKGRLEKRFVTLGIYNEDTFSYEIEDGLTTDDFIAFPDEHCAEGVGTTHNASDVVIDDPTPDFDPDVNPSDVVIDDPEFIDPVYPAYDDDDIYIDIGGGDEDPDVDVNGDPATEGTIPTPTSTIVTAPTQKPVDSYDDASDGDIGEEIIYSSDGDM